MSTILDDLKKNTKTGHQNYLQVMCTIRKLLRLNLISIKINECVVVFFCVVQCGC